MLLPFRAGRPGLGGGSLRMLGSGGRGRLILGSGPLCLLYSRTQVDDVFFQLSFGSLIVAVVPGRG